MRVARPGSAAGYDDDEPREPRPMRARLNVALKGIQTGFANSTVQAKVCASFFLSRSPAALVCHAASRSLARSGSTRRLEWADPLLATTHPHPPTLQLFPPPTPQLPNSPTNPINSLPPYLVCTCPSKTTQGPDGTLGFAAGRGRTITFDGDAPAFEPGIGAAAPPSPAPPSGTEQFDDAT